MLFINHSGQDIEVKLSGGGTKDWRGDGSMPVPEEWALLPEGAEMPIVFPGQPCTIEVRVGDQIFSRPVDEPLESIEVSRNLKLKLKRKGQPTAIPDPKDTPPRSGGGLAKPGAGTKLTSRTTAAGKPSASRGRAAG